MIVKAEHKNPMSRYGIDRMTLRNSNLSVEDQDRIYRALFVHSVGFFELLKKVLNQTEKDFAILTAIWKVF